MSNRNNRYTGNTVGYTHGLYSGSTVVDAPRGMWIGNPSSNLIDWNPTITHNWVHDVDATGFALHTVGVNFTGNTADDTKGAGVKLTPPPGSGQQSVISDNRFRRNLFHGVQISGADAPVIIQNNLLEGNGNGIYVAEGGFNNSQIINNTITGSRYAGIYLYNGNGVVIQNNRIQSSAQTGIGLEAISGRSIANVQISGNGVSGTNGDAIALLGRGGSISSVAISANSISDSARYGILIEPNGISGASLTGNCFSNNRVGTLLDQRGALIAPLTSALCSLLGGLPSQSSSSQPPQTTPPVVVQPPSQPAFTPIRINAGGQQYVDPSGTVWATDFGYAQGKFDFVSTPIQNTNASPLYQTARWWDRVLDYNFQVPAGRTYTVTLKFAETYFSGPNQRLQDIYANGQLVLGSFDILAQAGGMYRAVDRTFQVTAPNGSIALKFVGRVDDPFVSGVEIK
jgi:parallel beta-helix repeat protein